jgi:c-di-GMP-related signal transduction protein
MHQPPPMQVFVARQPIFDARQRVVAYELLFRSGLENCFPRVDGDMASSRVIRDALAVFGLKALAGDKKVYVNVSRRVLCDGLYSVLPAKQTVVELLETVEADDETVAAVRSARGAGYEVALDDYVPRPALDRLVRLANVLKVDFLVTVTTDERRRVRDRHRNEKVTLLAEKVETSAAFGEAVKLGYSLFQGYFFQHPEIVSREDIPASKLTYVRFLKELSAPELDWSAIERAIKHDVSLSVKLLRFLNSAAFGWRSRVTTLKNALVMLGERPFRKWASLIAVVGMTDDRPPELALTCLGRARLAEQLCPLVGLAGRELDAFLVGLFSSLDAMVGRPLPELLAEISVSPEIDAALLGGDSPLGKLRLLVMAYERGAWNEVTALATSLRLPEDRLPEPYRLAIEWAAQTLPR